jgi:integrase/recombinase XerD
LWLERESIETTNEYLHANMAIREEALATLQPVGKKFRRFKADDTLLEFLATL